MAKPRPAGNTQELERLEKELAAANDLVARITKESKDVDAKYANEVKANGELKKSLEIATEKLKFLELGMKQTSTEIAPGYVEIASCPIGDVKPPSPVINKVMVARRIDEDGICYEIVPIKIAIRMLNEGSGFKRYLVGPKNINSIKDFATVGIYSKELEFFMHKKRREISGKWEFIKVIVE